MAAKTASAAMAIGSSISSRRLTKMSSMIGLINWVKAAVLSATTVMHNNAAAMRPKYGRRYSRTRRLTSVRVASSRGRPSAG